METLRELLEDQLKDLYNAEKQLIKALPKMAKKATTDALKQAFTDHLEETQGHVERLEQIGSTMDIKLTGKKCAAMEGLIEEGEEIIDEEEENLVCDAALIAAAQRVEHYEISAYGTARTLAEQLGENEGASLLQATLEEESAADEKLTTICEKEIFPNAQAEEGEELPDDGAKRRR